MSGFKSTSAVIGAILLSLGVAHAQTNFTLGNLTTFGPNGDGSLRPGDRNYLTSTAGNGQLDNLQRGIAYNPLTDHLLVVNRSNSTTLQGIYIVDAVTGNDAGSLDTNGIIQGAAGGTFCLLKIGVADDGVIYAANFGGFGGTTNIVYRWSDESAAPTIAFYGDPSAGTTNRSWGVTFDVRGAGTNTQILMGSQGTVASVLTTINGTNFTANVLNTDALPGDFEHGCVFGQGSTFWGKAVDRALRLFSFNLVTSNATTIRGHYTNEMPASLNLGQMAFDPARNILSFLEVVTGMDHVRLYDVSNPNISPVLLDVKDFSVDNTNVNNAGALDFAADRLFALDCNNGLQAFTLSSNEMAFATVITDPASQQIPINSPVYFEVHAYRGVTYQWQHEGTNIPGATNISLVISNVQLTDGGNYQVFVRNSAGSIPSAMAALTVTFPDDAIHLNPLWSLAPLSRAYLPADTDVMLGRTPFYRSLAYNPLSNHVYIVSRTGANAGLSVNVLDATTGADLYKLRTNGIGPLPVSANSIILVMIGVAEDGAVYAGNMAYGGGSTPAGYRLYRWANGSSNTDPVLVFAGEPAGSASVLRWGDTMAVGGAGTNTQVMIDQASTLAIFRPTDATMTIFGPQVWTVSNPTASSVGRTLLFGSTSDTVWQKRYGFSLFESSFDFAAPATTFLYLNNSIPGTAGPLGFDFANHLLALIVYSFNPAAPDSLNLYDVADLDNPLLLGSYPFPTTSKPNSTGIGQVVFANGRVYALNGNNGVLGFTAALQLIPQLEIARSGENILLSWTNSVSGYTLQSNTNLSSTNWVSVETPVSVSNRRYFVTDSLTNGPRFYRLIK